MLMPDINILIYTHREDEKCHEAYARWLKSLVYHQARKQRELGRKTRQQEKQQSRSARPNDLSLDPQTASQPPAASDPAPGSGT